MQKLLLTLMAGLLFLSSAYGQEVTKSFSGSGTKKIKILAENAEWTIEGHSGSQVIIQTDAFRDHEEDERAKGLRPLYNDASDNTGIGLEVNEVNNVLSIKKAISEDIHYILKIPADASISIEEIGWMNDGISIANHNGEIEIKGTGSDIRLENIGGPIVANTTSGDIDVLFSQVKQDQPTSISNISGHIDIAMPANAKASFVLNSVTGETYTDLDIKMEGEEEGMRRLGARKMKGTLNGGGVELTIRAISGNIYLRKK